METLGSLLVLSRLVMHRRVSMVRIRRGHTSPIRRRERIQTLLNHRLLLRRNTAFASRLLLQQRDGLRLATAVELFKGRHTHTQLVIVVHSLDATFFRRTRALRRSVASQANGLTVHKDRVLAVAMLLHARELKVGHVADTATMTIHHVRRTSRQTRGECSVVVQRHRCAQRCHGQRKEDRRKQVHDVVKSKR